MQFYNLNYEQHSNQQHEHTDSYSTENSFQKSGHRFVECVFD